MSNLAYDRICFVLLFIKENDFKSINTLGRVNEEWKIRPCSFQGFTDKMLLLSHAIKAETTFKLMTFMTTWLESDGIPSTCFTWLCLV